MDRWLMLLLFQLSSVSSFVFRPSQIVRLPVVNLVRDDSVDLTPDQSGKIIKRILRKGDAAKGRPFSGDTLHIGWKIFNSANTLVHSTLTPSQAWLSDTQTEEEERTEESPFDFILGDKPSDVISGWEMGIATMFEGEIASFELDSDLAFGVKGLNLGIGRIVAPGERVRTEIELYRIIASPFRTLERVGPDESIKDELMEKIRRGESPISREALQRGQTSGVVRAVESPTTPTQSDQQLQAGPGERLVEELSYIDIPANQILGPKSKTQKESNEKEPKNSVSTLLDGSVVTQSPELDVTSPNAPKVDSLSTNQLVSGEGRGHSWTEDARIIDVFLPLPGPVKKHQLLVQTEKSHLTVVVDMLDGSTISLFDGPLKGSVRPSATSWALLPPDPSAVYKGERVQVSLEKAHGSTTVWASVYSLDYLNSPLRVK